MTKHRRICAATSRRSGFTLLEVTLVGGLMAFLAVLLTSAWKGIGRFPVDIMARSQLLQEMDLAVAALSRDVGGFMPIPSSSNSSNYGGKNDYSLVGCRNILDTLELCYDKNGDNKLQWDSDNIVTYYLADDPNDAVDTKVLVREREYDNKIFTVARYVEDIVVSKSLDSKWIVVELTFKHPHPRSDHTRKLTLHLKCME